MDLERERQQQHVKCATRTFDIDVQTATVADRSPLHTPSRQRRWNVNVFNLQPLNICTRTAESVDDLLPRTACDRFSGTSIAGTDAGAAGAGGDQLPNVVVGAYRIVRAYDIPDAVSVLVS